MRCIDLGSCDAAWRELTGTWEKIVWPARLRQGAAPHGRSNTVDAMIVMSGVRADRHVCLDAVRMGLAVNAIGTLAYDLAGLAVFEHSLGADHWAMFVHRAGAVSCVASASREHVAAAEDAVRSFVTYCHTHDPSLVALTRPQNEPGCMISMGISDIVDAQYRRCFEITGVRERLSLYARRGADLHQLSIYRGPRRHGFSQSEMRYFRTVAGLMMATAAKHQILAGKPVAMPAKMDIAAIEQLFNQHSAGLSRREREVSSRAAIGMTIDGTALDLHIKRTSVITYRQRAYQKLGVSCQNELVAVINNFRVH